MRIILDPKNLKILKTANVVHTESKEENSSWCKFCVQWVEGRETKNIFTEKLWKNKAQGHLENTFSNNQTATQFLQNINNTANSKGCELFFLN